MGILKVAWARLGMEKGLRESEVRYRSVFESTSDAVLIFDHEGVIVEANPAACRMHGCPYGGLIGLSGKQIVHPDYHEHFEDHVRRSGGQFRAQSVGLRRGGTPIHVEIQGFVLDYRGRPHLLVVAREINDGVKVGEFLERHVQTRTRELTTLLEVVRAAAAEEERARLARELHDSVIQSLYSVTLFAEAARRLAAAGDAGKAVGHLTELGEAARQGLKDMRLLVYELRPAALEREGLVEALRQRLDTVERRAGVEASFSAKMERKLPHEVEDGLYRIAQEALNNALKHAHADSVTVQILLGERHVELEIADDGRGFDPAEKVGGLGLANMQERAQGLGGTLSVSSALGQGTKVRAVVPLG